MSDPPISGLALPLLHPVESDAQSVSPVHQVKILAIHHDEYLNLV